MDLLDFYFSLDAEMIEIPVSKVQRVNYIGMLVFKCN